MKISEIRVKLVESPGEKLQAFCGITVDDAFAIRDMKIIQTGRGFFVAMPSRKLSRRCSRCRTKNHLRANFCNECGQQLSPVNLPRNEDGRLRLHADVAYPIHACVREQLHQLVIRAYEEELARSKEPGYVAPEGVFDDEDLAQGLQEEPPHPAPPPPRLNEEEHRDSFGAGIT